MTMNKNFNSSVTNTYSLTKSVHTTSELAQYWSVGQTNVLLPVEQRASLIS